MSQPSSWHPDWRGRRKFWEDTRWSRTPELDLAVGLYRWQTAHGWEARYYLLFRRIGEDQVYQVPVLSQTFITSPTGSLQTSTSDATWNNSNNKVECIGPGGGGAVSARVTGTATGGGGGQYAAIANFTFATPGTTTYQWQVGTGGAAKVAQTASSNGNVGVSATWFNAASDPGAGSDNSQCSAKPGGAGTQGSTPITAAGGGTGGWGTTLNTGGNYGGQSGTGTNGATGGGGAAGPNGAGGAGVSISTATGSAGGQGDNTHGGTGGGGVAGTGAQTASPGNPGTELGDSTHGCGGGGGGARSSSGALATGGTAGNYGAGGGGAEASNASGSTTSGAGIAGIIVLTWTPAASFTWLSMFQDAVMPWQMHGTEIIGY